MLIINSISWLFLNQILANKVKMRLQTTYYQNHYRHDKSKAPQIKTKYSFTFKNPFIFA